MVKNQFVLFRRRWVLYFSKYEFDLSRFVDQVTLLVSRHGQLALNECFKEMRGCGMSLCSLLWEYENFQPYNYLISNYSDVKKVIFWWCRYFPWFPILLVFFKVQCNIYLIELPKLKVIVFKGRRISKCFVNYAALNRPATGWFFVTVLTVDKTIND